VATAKEFVEFWLENSVHAEEPFQVQRRRPAVQRLADNLVRAAETEGFTRTQMEIELGGSIYDFIRADIDRQNVADDIRLDGKK
jgi:hypothetical protein